MPAHTRYSRLANITQLINSNLDLRAVLEQVVVAISDEVIQCNSVGIYWPQADGTFRGYVGKPDSINGITLDQMVVDPKIDMLAAEIVHTKKSIYIADTSMDNRIDPRPVQLFQIKSMLGLPIVFEDELFGLAFLFDVGTPMNLTADEIQSVEAYVNMAAVAIRNTNLFQKKQALLSEKQLLLDATRDLAHCLTAQSVMDTSFHYLGQAVNNFNIGVHLSDAIGKRFRPAKLNQESDWTEQDWKKVHQKIQLDYNKDLLFQEVIQTKTAIFIPDVTKDHRPNQDACERFGIKGIFMLPLVAMGEVLGTMAVVSLDDIRHYTEAEKQLAQSIVDATATALSNVLRMEQLELIVRARTAELHERNGLLEQVVLELKSLDQMKNEFIASVSHELRTPITAIKGSIELLKTGALGPLNSDQNELIDMAEQGVTRLVNRVNDLLDYARIQDGSFPTHKTETDYADVVSRTIEIATPLFTKKGQTLIKQVYPIPRLQIDPERMEQVLLNLLTNASKFTPEHGNITVIVEDTEDGVLTCVEDTGIGIPAESLGKIFDRFYQVQKTDDPMSAGNGLGLPIAKQIVESHDGELWAESEAGQGSRFYFLLPRA